MLAVFLCLVLWRPSLFDQLPDALIAPLLLIFIVLGSLLIATWLWPVIVVRNRFQERKEQELRHIDEALSGNTKALSNSLVGANGPLSPLELIQYQAHIRSSWKWRCRPISEQSTGSDHFCFTSVFSWTGGRLVDGNIVRERIDWVENGTERTVVATIHRTQAIAIWRQLLCCHLR